MGATTIAGLILLCGIGLMARRRGAEWTPLPVEKPPVQATKPTGPEVQLTLPRETDQYRVVPMQARAG